jgi:hypothetical protein
MQYSAKLIYICGALVFRRTCINLPAVTMYAGNVLDILAFREPNLTAAILVQIMSPGSTTVENKMTRTLSFLLPFYFPNGYCVQPTQITFPVEFNWTRKKTPTLADTFHFQDFGCQTGHPFNFSFTSNSAVNERRQSVNPRSNRVSSWEEPDTKYHYIALIWLEV